MSRPAPRLTIPTWQNCERLWRIIWSKTAPSTTTTSKIICVLGCCCNLELLTSALLERPYFFSYFPMKCTDHFRYSLYVWLTCFSIWLFSLTSLFRKNTVFNYSDFCFSLSPCYLPHAAEVVNAFWSFLVHFTLSCTGKPIEFTSTGEPWEGSWCCSVRCQAWEDGKNSSQVSLRRAGFELWRAVSYHIVQCAGRWRRWFYPDTAHVCCLTWFRISPQVFFRVFKTEWRK